MSYRLRNEGPQGRVVFDRNQRPVTLLPGESKVANLDEYMATTIHIDAANGDTLKIERVGATPRKETKASRATPEPVAEEVAPLPPSAPAEAAGEPAGNDPGIPSRAPEKSSRRPPLGRGGPDNAKMLIREARAGLNFFELRRRAKELLGEDWPGGHLNKAEILHALERRG